MGDPPEGGFNQSSEVLGFSSHPVRDYLRSHQTSPRQFDPDTFGLIGRPGRVRRGIAQGLDGCLVKRGEFHLTLDFLDRWDEELFQMNTGKCGRPFQYPRSFIAWMANVYSILQMPYRQMEGFVRRLAAFIPNLKVADYTTPFRRIRVLDISLPVASELLVEEVTVAVDNTGIKVTNRGEWMREKWQVM